MKFFLIPLLGALQLLPLMAFKVGVGIYDTTGPATEINFMGYAVPGQRGSGIHLRLRARAFAFEDDNKHVVYVNVDGGMASDLVKTNVLRKLEEALGPGVYTNDNVAISGTHTHSGPGGFLPYVLYQITSLGFVEETFNAWVNGITNAILAAHKDIQPAKTFINEGDLYESNINRSPTSYLLNPEEERNQYPEGDTDKKMLLLSFFSEKRNPNKPMGLLNWFAVHGTSMNNTNTLISGDNKGYAAYLYEREMNGGEVPVGHGAFVAGFASTNLGDVSPNTNGAKCIDTGLPCNGEHSSCNNKCENCIAFGPGVNGDMFQSTQIIGSKQYTFAKSLVENAKELVTGPIDYRHTWVDMSQYNVTLASGEVKQLCSPAMGYSFAAGTTDGPGMFNFVQGETSGNPFWDKVRDFLSKPTDSEMACQAPKPILLNTGDLDIPHQWDPRVLPFQIIRLGNVFILSAPSELTTMAGRRLRNAIRTVLESDKKKLVVPGQKIHIVISGLTNTYSSYVTTYEEYQAQRYEAASTIFGPHTLEGYIQVFTSLAKDLITGTPSTPGIPPVDYTDHMIQLIPEPRFDRVAKGNHFGQVLEGQDVLASYTVGQVAKVTFHAANPRNNQRIQGSYVFVEEKMITKESNKVSYKAIAHDGDWSTKFHWQAGPEDPLDFGVSKQSKVTVSWEIDNEVKSGTYRICYHGDHKVAKMAQIVPFRGCSSEFVVTNPNAPLANKKIRQT